MYISQPPDARPVVAVLDASDAVRTGVEELLRVLPATVIGFADAATLITALECGLRPVCLIADLGLAECSPGKLLETLKFRGLTMPTILLFGDAEIACAVSAMRAGAMTCIEKPYLARFLVEQVSPLLEDALGTTFDDIGS